MPEVVFHTRAEDRPRVGSGHLQRSIRFARYLHGQGFDCRMLVKRTTLADRLLAAEDFQVAYWDDYDYKHLAKTDFVIVDDYLPSEQLLKRITANHPRRAIIGFDVTRHFGYYDETVNAITPHIQASHSGLGFSLHQVGPRAEFPVAPGVNRVFLSFGNYDHRSLLRRSVAIIDEHFSGIEVNAFPDTGLIMRNNTLVKEQGFREALLASDVAVVSGGLTLFDAVYTGIPSVAWCQYRHQVHNASLFGDCVINAGLTDNAAKVAGHLASLSRSREQRQRMRNDCLDTLGDKGYERIYEILLAVAA